jgi:hypothetical protein
MNHMYILSRRFIKGKTPVSLLSLNERSTCTVGTFMGEFKLPGGEENFTSKNKCRAPMTSLQV